MILVLVLSLLPEIGRLREAEQWLAAKNMTAIVFLPIAAD
jgi:hypothetical protein